jgi:DNA polymerase-4
LRAIGIARLVDVRAVDGQLLTKTVGSQAEWLRQLSHGIDDRPVVPDRVRKSCGTENTFATDLINREEICLHLSSMARDNAEWLQKEGLLARTVTIKVRYSDFSTITRSHTREVATNDVADISSRALELVERTEAGRLPVRLLGVSVHNLVDPVSRDPAPDTDTLPFAGPQNVES